MSDFIKKPCQHCPFRSDIKPFLTVARAEELACAAQNPYSSFVCHKTTEYDEDSDSGEMLTTEASKQCAGFLTLMHNELGETFYDEDGFTPSPEIIYSDYWEMIEAHEEARENK